MIATTESFIVENAGQSFEVNRDTRDYLLARSIITQGDDNRYHPAPGVTLKDAEDRAREYGNR